MKILFGTHHFDEGVKPCLMVLGTKFFTALCIESEGLRSYMVPFADKTRYFKELGNSDDNLPGIKRVARQLKRSTITGKKRDMTKKTKVLLQRILEWENTDETT